MKTLNRILLAAGAAVALTGASQVMAESQLSGPEGIAASPRVQQQMRESGLWPAIPAPEIVTSRPTPCPACQVTASPRVQQRLEERGTLGVAPAGEPVIVSGTRNESGIVASPRLQQQLNERPMQFQIAPLK